MENNEELNLEQDPTQQEQELELGEDTEVKPKEVETEVDPSDSDPLDSIDNVEDAVKEAKKFRSIASRKSSTKEEPKPAEIPKEGDYIKRTDFELVNQRKAIRLATTISENDSEEVKAKKADILENWDEVRKNYSPRRGKETPEDILEDITDAFVVFNNRRPPVDEVEEGDVVPEEITKTEAKAPVGNPPKPKTKTKNPPNFKLPKQPDEWYEDTK